MTRSLGGALTPALVERFSQRDLARRLGTALPFVTVDPDGRPHPMLLSYLELRAYDTGTVGLVIGAGTRSARNLEERGTGTVLAVEPEATVYVKLRTVDGPLPVAVQFDPRLAIVGVQHFVAKVCKEIPGNFAHAHLIVNNKDKISLTSN